MSLEEILIALQNAGGKIALHSPGYHSWDKENWRVQIDVVDKGTSDEFSIREEGEDLALTLTAAFNRHQKYIGALPEFDPNRTLEYDVGEEPTVDNEII